jgi:hypothetical protein
MWADVIVVIDHIQNPVVAMLGADILYIIQGILGTTEYTAKPQGVFQGRPPLALL